MNGSKRKAAGMASIKGTLPAAVRVARGHGLISRDPYSHFAGGNFDDSAEEVALSSASLANNRQEAVRKGQAEADSGSVTAAGRRVLTHPPSPSFFLSPPLGYTPLLRTSSGNPVARKNSMPDFQAKADEIRANLLSANITPSTKITATFHLSGGVQTYSTSAQILPPMIGNTPNLEGAALVEHVMNEIDRMFQHYRTTSVLQVLDVQVSIQ